MRELLESASCEKGTVWVDTSNDAYVTCNAVINSVAKSARMRRLGGGLAKEMQRMKKHRVIYLQLAADVRRLLELAPRRKELQKRLSETSALRSHLRLCRTEDSKDMERAACLLAEKEAMES